MMVKIQVLRRAQKMWRCLSQWMGWLVYGVYCHFQRYFSYNVYSGGQFHWWRKPEKTTVLSQVHVTDKLDHIMLNRVHLSTNGKHRFVSTQIYKMYIWLGTTHLTCRERGGGVCFFSKKKNSQCCWKKYSDFGGGKKNNLIQNFCHIT